MNIRSKHLFLNLFICASVFVGLTFSSCSDDVPPNPSTGADELCNLVGRDVLKGNGDTSFTMRYIYNSNGQIIRTKQYSGNEYYFPLWEDVDRADSADYFYTAPQVL